ncbi:MAG: Gfo/Idh/MocA family oxidoreductase [Clostridia bacterium]|nr:Gfo/Idh/MocA family oxidoreductase [Clostridia bacterium]
MYKIAILGCENSHANSFLRYIKDHEQYHDIQVMGVYSIDREAAEKLHEQFDVPVMDSYDQFVGQLDGLIITARHGDYHYRFAKPYLNDGIPMFIDKPITVSEEDAAEFASILKEKKIKVSGGSSLIYATKIQELKAIMQSGELGATLGGFMRAPVSLVNPHGDFFFYAQHLVGMMTEVFGLFPEAVYAEKNNNAVNCIVSYDKFDVHLDYIDGNYKYYALLSADKGFAGGETTLDGVFEAEFETYVSLLRGTGEGENLNEFFAPVYIMNAIFRSMNSGKRETVNYRNV